jgi:hypothetical protein
LGRVPWQSPTILLSLAPTISSGVAIVLVALLGAGCSSRQTLAPNQPPTVRLAYEALPGTETVQRHKLSWTGVDPDGDLDHYVYAVDPKSLDQVDAAWTSTKELECILSLPAAVTTASGATRRPPPHLFVVRAVDRHGEMSQPASRALGLDNQPPLVQIYSPIPQQYSDVYVPTQVSIRWYGDDPDGQTIPLISRFVYRLIPQSDPDYEPTLLDPNYLLRKYAPDFASWISVPGDSTRVVLNHLASGKKYLFAVNAFDQAGDYAPSMSLAQNVLRLVATSWQATGPRITVFSDDFYYQYPGGGYDKDPSHRVKVGVPAGYPFTIQWRADPPSSGGNVSYRWALDLALLDDDTPRSGPADLSHWSASSPLTTSATLGPFPEIPKGDTHVLYIEAADDLGFVSLAALELTATPAGITRKPLLIVDDTRFAPDQYMGSIVKPPSGEWPTAAELDTFLFARGGFPWRGYPAGTVSARGLFAGYSFDTLGTRRGLVDPTVPLSILEQYDHVIWLTDRVGATMVNPANYGLNPITALRYMASSGHLNTLAAYVNRGGHLWLAGGGVAYASQIPFNDPTNDPLGAGVIVFSRDSFRHELEPGRFMYDIARWQMAIGSTLLGSGALLRHTGRFGDDAFTPGPASPYAALPAALRLKTAATDVVPPLRTAGSFYPTSRAFEVLLAPVWPDESGSADIDTLYRAYSVGLPDEPAVNAAMTIWHGVEGRPSSSRASISGATRTWIACRSSTSCCKTSGACRAAPW